MNIIKLLQCYFAVHPVHFVPHKQTTLHALLHDFIWFVYFYAGGESF